MKPSLRRGLSSVVASLAFACPWQLAAQDAVAASPLVKLTPAALQQATARATPRIEVWSNGVSEPLVPRVVRHREAGQQFLPDSTEFFLVRLAFHPSLGNRVCQIRPSSGIALERFDDADGVPTEGSQVTIRPNGRAVSLVRRLTDVKRAELSFSVNGVKSQLRVAFLSQASVDRLRAAVAAGASGSAD